jgi:hypothetical protein
MTARGCTLLGLATFALALGAQGAIYRWTDAEGRVYFGDRPPAELIQEARDLSAAYAGRARFSFEIVPVDHDLPAETRAQVQVAVSKIHEIFESRLGLRFSSDPSFSIRIFKDREGFEAYGGPGLGHLVSGYYSPERNEAVTWSQQGFEQMLEVITHEAGHALLHHRFDEVPRWLDEGLSEYVERIQVFGQAVTVPPNPDWDAVVKAQVRDGSLMPLAEYVGLSTPGWLAHNLPENRAYARAWSLVYFMMSTPEGTQVLGRLLAALDRSGADGFTPAEVIGAHYPGGLAAFDIDWRAWVLGPKRAHYY